MPIYTFRESSRSQAWSQGAAEWILFNNKFDFIWTQGSDSINVSILPGPATRDKMAAAKEIWQNAFQIFSCNISNISANTLRIYGRSVAFMEQTIARSNA